METQPVLLLDVQVCVEPRGRTISQQMVLPTSPYVIGLPPPHPLCFKAEPLKRSPLHFTACYTIGSSASVLAAGADTDLCRRPMRLHLLAGEISSRGAAKDGPDGTPGVFGASTRLPFWCPSVPASHSRERRKDFLGWGGGPLKQAVDSQSFVP